VAYINRIKYINIIKMNFLKRFKTFRVTNRLVYLTGLFTVGNYFYKHCEHMYKKKDPAVLKDTYGQGWVVITGPTSGIGEEFAEQFSKLGYNLVLISRDQNKLENVSKRLEDKYKIKTKPIKFDFTECADLEKVDRLKGEINAAIDNNQVSALINNVGVHYEVNEKFTVMNQKQLADYVMANCLSQMTMYNILYRRLRDQPTKSLIIDVSSQLADIDLLPFDVVYQSTKTFNKRFTDLMRRQVYTENLVEGKSDNVDIALFKPGMTYSNLTPHHHERSPPIDTAEKVVKGALSDIAGGCFVTNGSGKHKFLSFILGMVPDYVSLNFIGAGIYKKDVKKD
jgi:short-subunit dehydrogenase